MQHKLAPGFRFNNGKLMIFTEDEAKLVNTWPDLEAVRKPSHGGCWTPFAPCFRMLRPRIGATREGCDDSLGPADVPSRAVDPNFEKQRAFWNFRQSIPPETVSATERFSNRQWALLRLCRRRQQVCDLLQQNPALGFALAQISKFRVCYDNPAELAARISKERQRDICRRLGFPGSQAWANILAKIPAEVVTPDRLLALRACANDADVEKGLCRLRAINAGVLALAEDQPLFRLVSAKLLAEIAETATEHEHSEVIQLLRDTVHLHSEMGTPHGLCGCDSIAEVRSRQQEAVAAHRRFLRRLEDRTWLPDPPLPGTEHIVALSTPDQLFEEAEKQHNCVGTYGNSIRKGGCYIYRVLAPERATLAIEKGPDGFWWIQQLYLACNRRVSPATWRAVKDWLSQYSISC